MKRLLLALFIALALSTAAFADHAQDSLGLGGIFGAGWGWGWNGWTPHPDFYPAGLSLKIPNVPLFWGIKVNFPSSDYLGLGVTGDFYFAEPNLVSTTSTNEDGSYQVKIDWYVGVGFYANAYLGHNYHGGDGGLRIPFGVSWHALGDIRKLEVSLGSVGGLGIGGDKYRGKPYLHWFFIPVEIAVRWWFGG